MYSADQWKGDYHLWVRVPMGHTKLGVSMSAYTYMYEGYPNLPALTPTCASATNHQIEVALCRHVYDYSMCMSVFVDLYN